MTEDQNDKTTEGPVSAPEPETAPTSETDTASQDASQAAIPLPATSASSWEQPIPLPEQPDTPPMGVPQGSTPPAGTTPPGSTSPPAPRRRRAPTPWAPSPATRPRAGARRVVRDAPAHRPRRTDVGGAA